MPDFPLGHQPGQGFALNWATAVAGHGTAHTKGNWVTVVASTAYDVGGLLVQCIMPASVANSSLCLFDIGIGAAASEVVICPNIYVFGPGGVTHVFIPINVPAGTRIAARVQSTITSAATWVNVTGIRGGFWGPQGGGLIHSFGENLAASTGTVLNAGAAANTYPALPMTELVAATTKDIVAIMPVVSYNPATTVADANFEYEIGVGASSSEVAVLRQGFRVELEGSSGSNCQHPQFWFPCSIPAGSRISARVRSSVTGAATRIAHMVLLGLVGN